MIIMEKDAHTSMSGMQEKRQSDANGPPVVLLEMQPAVFLARLEDQLVSLTKRRYLTVTMLQEKIDTINREYDEHALILNRQITNLRKQLAPDAPKKSRQKSLQPDDDWSPEEQAHFRRLAKQV